MKTFSRAGRELHYNGALANLAGIYAGVGDGHTTTDALIPPFDDDMRRLVDHRNNFTRHIMIPYWKYSPVSSVNTHDCVFRQSNGKWDLLSYNVDYFSRLIQMILKAAEKGIAVQIVLFDRTGVDHTLLKDSEYVDHKIRRWDDSPWNAANNVNGVLATGHSSGLPEFYQYTPQFGQKLRHAQQAWIELVVDQTRSYSNVFYEIMNEPIGGTVTEQVEWADWVVGVIQNRTHGSNLVFYNDHSGGRDVNEWKRRCEHPNAGETRLPNYVNVHGVIFHGTPTTLDPDGKRADGTYLYNFRNEKIFQASSDTANSVDRETEHWNRVWTDHCLSHKMMFQAHATKEAAAIGISETQYLLTVLK